MTGSHDNSPRLSLAMFVQPTCGNRGQTYGCGLSEHPSRSGRSPDPSLAANGLGPDDTSETYPDGGGAKLQRQLPAMCQAPAHPKPVQPAAVVPSAHGRQTTPQGCRACLGRNRCDHLTVTDQVDRAVPLN
jgi:hypothetical protein